MATSRRRSGGGGSGAVTSVAARTGDVVLTKADVGLTNVDNTSDANKPVSTAQAAANLLDRDRANHSGSQLASTVSDFSSAARLAVNSQSIINALIFG